ncbi:unnamed protein product [Urochloa decumbens]|uniref:FBD domain-containing protein n=1 Tax=Urochloa decumbens TaxID=240449 RepID=A0ABC9CS08_9POAL
MGMLSLNRLMLKQERRRRRRIQARNGSTLVPWKRDSLCQEGSRPQGGERSTFSGPNLPQDIWCHIHSLMPLRDSGRSACVSHKFLCSWRYHPKLIFTEETLGLKQNTYQTSDRTKVFTSRVDQVLKNHSGVGVKSLKIVIDDHHKVDSCQINSWLQSAITPGIEEVTLFLDANYRGEYNFPCSLLLDGRGNSIRYAITKLPSIVPHLESLTVFSGSERVNTPMVTNQFLHLKYLNIDLADDDDDETAFRSYDYLSLVSFLDASPVLETFILSVNQRDMHHESVFGVASSHLRQITEHKHHRLKKVRINGFCSAKSMVELTCHILENATALGSLTLDTIFSQAKDADDTVRCSGKCVFQSRQMIVEAHKALKVIERYILDRVPSSMVKLNVRRPCIRCHAIDESL